MFDYADLIMRAITITITIVILIVIVIMINLQRSRTEPKKLILTFAEKRDSSVVSRLNARYEDHWFEA